MPIPLQKMNVGKDDMEEGEVSSSDGEELGEYTPLQVGNRDPASSYSFLP